MNQVRPRISLGLVAQIAAGLALLSALSVPFLAQAHQNKLNSLRRFSSLKQLGVAFNEYLEDNQETFPLGFGRSASGGYMWACAMLFPADWPAPTDEKIRERIKASESAWPTALMPYQKSEMLFGLYPANTIDFGPFKSYQRSSNKELPPVGFTYNGLMMSYRLSRVTAPLECPLLWDGNGEVNTRGMALTSPTLRCDNPSEPCIYRNGPGFSYPAHNGSSSITRLPEVPLAKVKPGYYFMYADTHSRFVQVDPNATQTDFTRDPYVWYFDGWPTMPWTDGNHAWLFRPDYDHVK